MTSLSDAGFQNGYSPHPWYLNLSIQGLERTGKTHLALTAPGPVAYIPFDPGGDRVLAKYHQLGEKRVYAFPRLRVPRITGASEHELRTNASPVFAKFEEAYNAAVESPEVKSIVVDTATELYEVLRMARFGKLKQVKAHHYAPVNAEFRELIRRGTMADKHLILIHKVKPLYVNEKRQAGYERAGFAHLGYEVETSVETGFDKKTKEFHFTVLDCGQAPELVGETYRGELCDLAVFSVLMFGGEQ